LTSEEEKEHFNLLGEYKDVFAWSYQDMSRLDLKIIVHWLSIRKVITQKAAATTFSPRVNTGNRKEGEQTHRGGIHL